MFKKKVLSTISIILVICMMLITPAYASSAHQYQDSKKGTNQNWGVGKHGRFVINNGILKGNGYGNYFWENYVKRGDIILMIVRAFKLNAIRGDNFSDVPKNSYYYDAICTVKSRGIAKGDGKKFNPEKHTTIGEAIAFIERAASVDNSNVLVDTSVDLHDLFSEKDLNKPATRAIVSDMLYFILTGDTTEKETYDLDPIEYNINEDSKIKFNVEYFSEVLEDASNEDLEYVKFKLPSDTHGKLYHDYESSSKFDSLVEETDKYYADPDEGPDLAEITFIPYSNYTGIMSIEYTAFDEDDNPYTGTIEITVLETDGDLDTFNYTISEDATVEFDQDDFIDVLEDLNGEDLDYVKFTKPSSSFGKLYYDYESSSKFDSLVEETDKYYADPNDGPDLTKITFVPSSHYVGTASIHYTAFDEDEGSYAGNIEISVLEADGDLETIGYTTNEDTQIEFDEGDFSEVLKEESNEGLSYVKFTLPLDTFGKLYYGYESSSDYGSPVNARTEYYFDPDNGLDLTEVAFVPYPNYSGTVSIKYTAFDEDDSSFTGTIEIIVQESLRRIDYTTDEDTAFKFDEDDFSEALEDVSDKNLYYVKFILPSTSSGRLYYGYKSASDRGSTVEAKTKYYIDSDNGPDLEKVTFVPYSNYTGTVPIKYTAFDESGISYNGTIQIIVEKD